MGFLVSFLLVSSGADFDRSEHVQLAVQKYGLFSSFWTDSEKTEFKRHQLPELDIGRASMLKILAQDLRTFAVFLNDLKSHDIVQNLQVDFERDFIDLKHEDYRKREAAEVRLTEAVGLLWNREPLLTLALHDHLSDRIDSFEQVLRFERVFRICFRRSSLLRTLSAWKKNSKATTSQEHREEILAFFNDVISHKELRDWDEPSYLFVISYHPLIQEKLLMTFEDPENATETAAYVFRDLYDYDLDRRIFEIVTQNKGTRFLRGAMDRVARWGRAEDFDLIFTYLNNSVWRIRRAAARAMIYFPRQKEKWIPVLLSRVRNNPKIEHNEASVIFDVLSLYGVTEAADLILKLDPGLRSTDYLLSLSRLSDPRALRPFLERLGHRENLSEPHRLIFQNLKPLMNAVHKNEVKEGLKDWNEYQIRSLSEDDRALALEVLHYCNSSETDLAYLALYYGSVRAEEKTRSLDLLFRRNENLARTQVWKTEQCFFSYFYTDPSIHPRLRALTMISAARGGFWFYPDHLDRAFRRELILYAWSYSWTLPDHPDLKENIMNDVLWVFQKLSELDEKNDPLHLAAKAKVLLEMKGSLDELTLQIISSFDDEEFAEREKASRQLLAHLKNLEPKERWAKARSLNLLPSSPEAERRIQRVINQSLNLDEMAKMLDIPMSPLTKPSEDVRSEFRLYQSLNRVIYRVEQAFTLPSFRSWYDDLED